MTAFDGPIIKSDNQIWFDNFLWVHNQVHSQLWAANLRCIRQFISYGNCAVEGLILKVRQTNRKMLAQ
jgi:hypothetical protein